ncbi:outer membrane lipoprotein carrier protein LolA [Gluconobacter cerinus]|uniref:LolA family protein n=1 Tax=Gluconobacter TaxID=441 RepID=UPI001B8C512C|nr:MULTISPECIES: outer membrane lipoprotein carrier protein LolA [Gluconobacter]MBS0993660.1 outer membrane lipoprotein carrier protein LolA [Gluconobacter cerinus]MBS1021102.1 outer membrane lipoprotein carrier protein LolA [Gluconobacter cerinus]
MMNRLFFRAAVASAFISVAALPLPAMAQAVPAQLRPVDQGWVARVQDTLAQITTLQARFQQIAPDGKAVAGTATLDRPGRMRFDYDSPSPLLLVANDGKVVFQDRSVGQVTVMPLDRTPLGLLLRPDLKLSGDVTVTGFERKNGQINLQVEKTESPGEGNLTLMFSEAPLALLGWEVVDAQGRTTRIALSDIRMGGSVSQSLFTLPKSED